MNRNIQFVVASLGTWFVYLFVYYHGLRMIRSLVKLAGLVKSGTQMVKGCQRTTIVAVFEL